MIHKASHRTTNPELSYASSREKAMKFDLASLPIGWTPTIERGYTKTDKLHVPKAASEKVQSNILEKDLLIFKAAS